MGVCKHCHMEVESTYGYCTRTAECRALRQREVRRAEVKRVKNLEAELAALKVQRLYCTCGGIGCDTCRPELFKNDPGATGVAPDQ
jgi:hypothetical protein